MENYPDLAHLADVEPLPGSDALRSIVERHHRRRSRTLAAGLAAVAVAGPALGFAVARVTASDANPVVAAGRPTTGSTATTAAGQAGSAVGGITWNSGGFASSSSIALTGLGAPAATRVFLRTTADGIRIRAYVPNAKVPKVAPGEAAALACVPMPLLEGELSDDLATGQTMVIDWAAQSTTPNPMIVKSVDAIGLAEGSPMVSATVRTAPNVAKVVVRFVDGSTDQMAPVQGWAILAHHTTAAALNGVKTAAPSFGVAEAFDASGKSLGTAALTPGGTKPPVSCFPTPPGGVPTPSGLPPAPKPMGDGMKPITPGS